MSSINDASERERLLDAHNLANKFLGHALTILHLSRGTVIQDLPSFRKLNFPDSASIDVLARASFEAFLVFHFVFFAPTTADEKNFGHWCYQAAGIAERQNLPVSIREHVQQIAEEKELLGRLHTKLETNIIFQGITESQKRQVFEGKGRWKWRPSCNKEVSWRDIAIDAGFSEMLAFHIYKHLSGYAHSGSLSVLQMTQALENKEPEKLIKPSINLMNILTANMIQEYCSLFPEALVILKESGASQFMETWVHIGRRLGENLDISQASN